MCILFVLDWLLFVLGAALEPSIRFFFLLYQFVFTFYLNAQRMSVEHENMLVMLTRA